MRVAAAFVALFALAAPSVADTVPDEQYQPAAPPVSGVPGYIGAYYDDGIDDVRGTSYLGGGIPLNATPNGDYKQLALCSSFSDPVCAGSTYWTWRSYLPACNTEVATNCIVGVTAYVDGRSIEGTFERSFPDRTPTEFTGDPSKGIADGRSPGLWHFEGVTHDGGSEFFAVASLTGDMFKDDPSQQMRMSIYPVSVVRGTGEMSLSRVSDSANGAKVLGVNTDWRYLFKGKDEALIRWPFPTNTRFGMKVRLAKPMAGWLHGRVADPDVFIASTAAGQEISVTASPSKVPVLDVWSKLTDLPEPLLLDLKNERVGGRFYYGFIGTPLEQLTVSMDGGANGDEWSMRRFLMWLAVAKDTAAVSRSSWTVRTMRNSEFGSAQHCLVSDTSLAGFVSTNATVYLAGPPTFNPDTQSLDYKVASPHFDRMGGVNIGHYALAIRSDVARCVYGFRSAPVSATISIVSADGTEQVATTAVSEHDGWLYLHADGFTYSSPTVRVKLTQEQPKAEPTPTASPTPTPSETPSATATPTPSPSSVTKPAAKKTITCVKGKQTKRVTAVAPKCPTGWKLKK